MRLNYLLSSFPGCTWEHTDQKFNMIKFISIIILGCLISQAGSEWRENNPMSDARTGASIISYNSKFYIIGGRNHTEFLSDVQIYDPATDSWDTTSVPEMFTPRANASAVLFQDKIYVIGGRNKRGACKEVEALDLKTNQWLVKRTLRGPRSGLTAQVYKDSLLIFGGIDSDGYYLDKVEWYDADNDKWEKLPHKMSPPRVSMFSFLFNDSLFFSGGFYFSPLNSTAILTPEGNWQNGMQLALARGDGATVIKGDSVFLIGGESANGTTNIIEFYNTANSEISDYIALPGPRAGHSAGIWNDTLYVFGGYGLHSTDILSSVIVYHSTITGMNRGSRDDNLPDVYDPISSYPNPFNDVSNIEIFLPLSDNIELKIYDIQGRLIDVLVEGILPPGKYVYRWNINSDGIGRLSSGVYIAVLRTSSHIFTHKLLYVK